MFVAHPGNDEIGIQGAQRLACALEKNSTLTTLTLSANKIKDQGALRLAPGWPGEVLPLPPQPSPSLGRGGLGIGWRVGGVRHRRQTHAQGRMIDNFRMISS